MKRSEINDVQYKEELDFTKLVLEYQTVIVLRSGELSITWGFRCGKYQHSIQFFVTEEEIERDRKWWKPYSEGLIL